ncbi:acyl-CoA dehydrogenase family protein [Pseudomonas aeruginosa]|uniref:acyl-CoA dehydrogenase family protein n=1 Tax=Pseudomonas aeruginosa TaxID=287 RepID=UPI001FB768F8|nr:acyl-CoA dehydrogenase family protein [Pseudomonas aeruginosa]
MDFNLDDSQKKLARQIAETCRERLPERPTAHFSPEQWAVCGEAGLLGLSIPRDYGGQTEDPRTAAGRRWLYP